MARWKPTKAQRQEYAKRMKEAEEMYNFIESDGAIREGCWLEFVKKATNEVVSGTVINESYGAKTGQHTFTILTDYYNKKVLVKGRNLYDRLLQHIPGDNSKEQKRLYKEVYGGSYEDLS